MVQDHEKWGSSMFRLCQLCEVPFADRKLKEFYRCSEALKASLFGSNWSNRTATRRPVPSRVEAACVLPFTDTAQWVTYLSHPVRSFWASRDGFPSPRDSMDGRYSPSHGHGSGWHHLFGIRKMVLLTRGQTHRPSGHSWPDRPCHDPLSVRNRRSPSSEGPLWWKMNGTNSWMILMAVYPKNDTCTAHD